MFNPSPGIYLLEFPDGCYVGQSNNVKSRIYQHTSKMVEHLHPNRRIRAGYREFGMPIISVLCYCSLSELNAAEIYWMSQYNCFPNGYNQKPGGDYARSGVTDVEYNGVSIDNLPIFKHSVEDRLDSPEFVKTMETTNIMGVFKIIGLGIVAFIAYLFWVNPPAAIFVIFLLALLLKLQ